MKQGVRDRLSANEKSISTNIKEGNITHGSLHYISDMDSIPLPAGCREGEKMQAYRLSDDHKRIWLQGDKKVWRIYGGKQIPRDAEIANARLVRRNQNYYIQITFFVEWDEKDLHDEWEILERAFSLEGVGLDFGIETNITLSNGEKFNWHYEETECLKQAQAGNEDYRAWHLRNYGWEKSSNARLRVVNREYERIRRKKQDAINKLVHCFRDCLTVVQEEQIKSWHQDERYSDVVQHSIMGGVMKRLSEQSSTLVVSKWCRTTGVCPDCGHVLDEKLSLDDREWDCPVCGAHHDRDVAAARTIFLLGVVSLAYPVCPSALSRDVFVGLLGVLGLDVPKAFTGLSGSGRLKPERSRAATGIKH